MIRNVFKKIIVFSMCIMMLAFVGCSEKEEKTTEEKKEEVTTEEKTTVATTETVTTTEVTTEEVKSEFVMEMLMSNRFYMPGVQDMCVTEYLFQSDGTVTEARSDYNPSEVFSESTYSYVVDEDAVTVTIDFNGYPRTYEYAETLGGFINDYDDGGDPFAPPSYYEFALIPFENMPNMEELNDVYKNYMEYYEGPIDATEAPSSTVTSEGYPYVKYSEATMSWNGLGESSFVCEGTELSILVMVEDGVGGTIYSYNSLENPEAHVVFTMRPTDVSNNVIVGGLNLIDPNADMIYLGLYEENGEKWIDMYDVETNTHTYYKESK